jgi:hypothetical protein
MGRACHQMESSKRMQAALFVAPLACREPSCQHVTQFAYWEAGDLRIFLGGVVVEAGQCASAGDFIVRDLPGPQFLRGPRKAYWEAEEKKGDVSATEAEGQIEMDEINALDADNIKRVGKPTIIVETAAGEE